MFHKIYKNNFFIYLFLFLVINSSIAVYSGLYICYIFKSFIYVLIFYLHCFIISSILTGISLLKVQDTSFVNIIFFSFNNFFEILFNGINRIFFYEAYQNDLNFNIIVFSKNFSEYDKIIFLTFIFSNLISLLNLRFNKIP